MFYYYGGWSSKIEGSVKPVEGELLAYTVREPLGVVCAITPFNFPMVLSVSKLAPALACGNTVIHKPASATPLSAIKMAEIMDEAGVPLGVFNLVTGPGGSIGKILATHPDIDKIAITGSTNTGKQIIKDSADTLKHVTVELGGKSPDIIFADADLDNAVNATMSGLYFNKGEICFVQNYLGFTNSIKSQGVFYAPLADSRTSFVDIRDIAAVAVEALTKSGHENRAYNITGPEAVSNYDIANILSKTTGKKITYVNVSDDDARKEMKDNGMQEWTINALIELSNFQKAGKASVVTSDVKRVTGREPISFEQFAKDYSETFRSS
jgi:hypothetical protein